MASAVSFLAGLPQILASAATNADNAPGYQPHGGGYYQFNIGRLKATVVSDGYGNFPFWPVFAANQQENHLGKAIQATNNLLVVTLRPTV